MSPPKADQSNLAAQPQSRDDFTTEKIVSSRIMRAEGATMKQKNDVADKIKRCVRARELGKKHYTKHRNLLAQIANEIESGREVQLGDGTKATLIDQFADKMTVFRPLGVSRYEIELENV
jgi:hypothetical protein